MKTPVQRLLVLLAAWAVVAAVAVSFRWLSFLPVPQALNVPLAALALTITASILVWRARWLDSALENIGVRRMLGAHAMRFVGAVFLWMHAQGKLPVEFAYRAGWGDIATAALGIGLLFWPEQGRGFRRALWWWNLFGLADLVVAVGTAAWLNITRPGSMTPMGELPLALIPLFAVPVFLASHVWVFRWLHRGQTGRPANSEPAVFDSRGGARPTGA